MATTKKVARSKTQGKAAKAPAEVLREQRARIEEALKMPTPRLSDRRANPLLTKAVEDHAAAHQAMRDIPVPMTLGEICEVIGSDVVPGEFGSSALRSIADQIKTTAVLVETEWSDDSWRLFENLSARAELAGRVAGWLGSQTSTVATEGAP